MGRVSKKDQANDRWKIVVGQAVRLFRLAQNLDQSQAAAKYNAVARTRQRLTQSTISNIETGRSQTEKNLDMVATALGVRPEEIRGLATYLLRNVDSWGMSALGIILESTEIVAGSGLPVRSQEFLAYFRSKAAVGMAYETQAEDPKPAKRRASHQV